MKAFVQFCLILALGCTFASLRAQAPSQVIVANGGVFGSNNYVTVASWDLTTGNYVVFDSFPASSVQDVNIHSRDAYVCADSFVVRYNLDNLTREAMGVVYGARQSAVFEDKVIVTKGFGSTGENAVVLNASDLSQSYEVMGITGNTEGVVVVGDTAYLTNPSSFIATEGAMAVVDMSNASLNRVIDLDTMGRQIQDLYKYQNKLYSINIIKFNNPTYSVISEFDIATTAITHHRVDLPAAQGAGVIDGKLYADFNGSLGVFDLVSGTISDTVLVAGFWSGMTTDSVNDRLYLTETDYATYGRMYSYDLQGNRLDSIDVGISPEALAVDYNITVGANETVSNSATIGVFPQPFGSEMNVDLRSFKGKSIDITLFDLYGRVVLSESVTGNEIVRFETNTIAPGAYVLRAVAGNQVATVKVIKTAK